MERARGGRGRSSAGGGGLRVVASLAATVVLSALWALLIAWPGPATGYRLEVRGDTLVLELGGGGSAASLAPEVLVDGRRLGVRPRHGRWLAEGLPGDRAVTVEVTTERGLLRVSGVQGLGAPASLQGLAAGHQALLEVQRAARLWWGSSPQHVWFLAPGTHAVPAPAFDGRPWVLHYDDEGVLGQAVVDPRPAARAWVDARDQGPQLGIELRGQDLWDIELARLVLGPGRALADRPWRAEVLAWLDRSGDRSRVRGVWDWFVDWEALAARAGRDLMGCPEGLPGGPFEVVRLARDPGGESERLELVQRDEDVAVAAMFGGLVNVESVRPPGRGGAHRFFVWPSSTPDGRGALVLVLRVVGSPTAWYRLQEIRLGQTDFRVDFPPRSCPGGAVDDAARVEEWLVWTLGEGTAPQPRSLVQLRAWEHRGEGAAASRVEVEGYLARLPGPRR